MLNWWSAVAGALACGMMTWLCARLTGSLIAGAAGGLLLTGSYTFWSQAIIGEVYALHVLMTGLVLVALLWWSRAPSLRRLSVVFGLYALGFGNHLMMVLLAPAMLLFIIVTPGGLRQLLSPAGLAIAGACAGLGAAQYLWNASFLWRLTDPPLEGVELWRTFWFDVTKSDWRSSMVLGVHESALKRRVGLYWFDVRQQIGVVGIALACLGLFGLRQQWRVVLLLVTAFLAAFSFAYTYNVGDVHVFFLPSHQILIVLAAAGIATIWRWTSTLRSRAPRAGTAAAAGLLLAFPVWHIHDTWPAVDRYADQRPRQWLDALTHGLGDDALLVADVNWQLDNGLDYYTRHVRPELNIVRARDAALTLPFLLRDNASAGREIVMTPDSRRFAQAAYGDLVAFRPDPRVPRTPLVERLRLLEPGMGYVIALLAPYPDLPFDETELQAATRYLTSGTAMLTRGPSYQVLAGLLGAAPALDRRDDLPFRRRTRLNDVVVDIRMESWLPADTMRRAGFGHVVANGEHVLTLERGVSVVAFDREGAPRLVVYASGLFAPLPRYIAELANPVPAWPGPYARLPKVPTRAHSAVEPVRPRRLRPAQSRSSGGPEVR